jgi:hypothetical protein
LASGFLGIYFRKVLAISHQLSAFSFQQ